MKAYQKWVPPIERMFDEMPQEYQEGCKKTWEAREDKTPEAWEDIVTYYYLESKKPPYGWFQWWDD